MKALTLWEPWASAIVFGEKRIENRVWKPPRTVRGKRIAIHPAASSTDWGTDPQGPGAALLEDEMEPLTELFTAIWLQALLVDACDGADPSSVSDAARLGILHAAATILGAE